MTEVPTPEPEWLIDGHVHFHACFEEELFLRHALTNFAAARRDGGAARPGVLLFTECAGVHYFRRLRDRGTAGAAGRFSVHATAEPDSLEIREQGEPQLLVIAGRQVATAESLEVLALGADTDVEDGRPIDDTIAAVRRAGGLAVVPWGFGKWWFARGAIVASLLAREDPARFFLGDNGGRPRLGRRPLLFEAAERRGFRVIPGSDPFPLAHHAARAGSYGFRLAAALDPRRPAATLKAALADRAMRPVPYGTRARLLPFVRNQVALRLRKRNGKAA